MKRYEELTVADDFMFAMVMKDKRICKKFLEKVLSIRIKDIEYPTTQASILNERYGGKSVRLDVYVEDDEKTIYDIEMQATDKNNLAKRGRFYQSITDVDTLSSGQEYETLGKSFVLFVTNFDKFGLGLPIYWFEDMLRLEKCLYWERIWDDVEPDSLVLGDEAYKIFVNATAQIEKFTEDSDLVNFFRLIRGESIPVDELDDDNLGKMVYNRVEQVKNSQEGRDEYVRTRMVLAEARREGEIIMAEKLSKLISLLLKDGRLEEIQKVTEDEAFREEMFKKYNIE